jgi:hypothetical protein
LLAVVALLGLATLAAALSSVQITRVPLPRPAGPDGGGVAPSVPGPSPLPRSYDTFRRGSTFALPGWLGTLTKVVCVAVAVVLVLLLIWYLLRDKMRTRTAITLDEGVPQHLGPGAEEVAAAVDAGLVELSDTDRDPRRAVIACWVRLEEAAAAAGTQRRLGDTPTELVLRLLSAHRVSRQVLDGFATVYREARYSTGPVDERMRATAVNALRLLRAELAAGLGPAMVVDPVGGSASGDVAVSAVPAPRRVRPGGPEGIP